MMFQAYKHKLSEDSEGEVTLILKVSQQEKDKVLAIPVQTLLKVQIEEEK